MNKAEQTALATVLIVDDDPDFRKFLRQLLIMRGHQVLDVSNGEDALVLCRLVHPDLIIVDLLMPGMDGYELVWSLRKEEGTTGTPIIFFTGTFEGSEAQSLAEQCGVQQVHRKPCSTAEILQAVDAALSAPAVVTKPNVGFDRQHTGESCEALRRNTDELATVSSQLAASERAYRELFEGHPEPMVVLDAQSLAFLNVNEATVRDYGYSRDEFLAMSVRDIYAPEDLQEAIAVLQRTRMGQVSPKHLSRHYRKDGSLIEVERTIHKVQFGGRPAYFVLSHDVTERNRHERTLRESQEQLRLLAGRLQQVREEERASLARELHDDLGQFLTAIKMNLSWLAGHAGATPGAISGRITSSMDLADRTLDTARRLASELRPGALDLGLQAALEWQVVEFRYHADIRCELELPTGKIPLSPSQEVALFRIFQETLTNVARHSGASLITAKLNVEEGEVTLAVQDNGRGISPAEIANRSSLGLLGMHERILALGGSMAIEGKLGVGTLVRVRVPVVSQPVD